MVWETVPLATFGERVPDGIASCWLFVIRPGAVTGAERHPDSHQRPAPESEHCASETDWSAEGWEAPEAGLERATRSFDGQARSLTPQAAV
jgi:hypothetical protein